MSQENNATKREAQPFEQDPEMTAWISEMATHGRAPKQWTSFVARINQLYDERRITRNEPTTEKQPDSEFKVGEKLECMFGNSGNKFWSDQLKPFVIVSEIKYHSSGIPKLKFEGIDSWFFENDFKLHIPIRCQSCAGMGEQFSFDGSTGGKCTICDGTGDEPNAFNPDTK